jgi:hypothetical protein
MKTGFFFSLLMSFCFLTVQGQNEDCDQQAASIDKLIGANDYENAYLAWKLTGKCVSESLYANGEKIFTYKLATPITDAEKKEYTASLLKIYSDYDKNFPNNKNSNAVKKAMLLNEQPDKDNEVIFTLLDSAFKNHREDFTNANALNLYFDLYYNKYKSAAVTEDNFFAKQDELAMHVEQLSKTTQKRDYRNVLRNIRALTSGVMTCDKLQAYYTKQFEAKKTDSLWLQRASENLVSGKCAKSPVFLRIATEWYALKPNAKSAFYLAKASQQQKDRAAAMKYYGIAAGLETDPAQKAEIYYTMAMTDRQNATDNLKKAVAAKPSMGKAYLMMAEMYASSGCGNNPFEQKAIYFLAAKTARKAGELDPTMKKAGESMAESFMKKAPTRDEIKSARKAGKTIAYGCGINESVTLPE